MNQTKLILASMARTLVGNWKFCKRLPAKFGGARVRVTARSDIRLLQPGFNRCLGDLLQVAEICVKPGDCVWDIGSNLGVFAFCAAWQAGKKGRVYTLEADPFYAEMQQLTVQKLSAGYAPVVPLCAAAAHQLDLLELAIPKRGHSRNHLRLVAGNDAGETDNYKQVVAVDATFLCKHWPKPDFIKIDIEGAEGLFMQGATQLLAEARPGFYIEVSEANRDAITQLFKAHSYQMFLITPDGKLAETQFCHFNTLVLPAEKVRQFCGMQVEKFSAAQ